MTNVLIVEDEALAADRLENLLKETDKDITVLAKTGSIKESVKWLTRNTADLILLDIQLSDGLSFSIFDQISVPTPVIFTTAYDQYAIKAFQLNSISYLLKPVRKKDLAESIQKYKNLKSAYSIDFGSLLSAIQGNKPEFRKRFLIQIADKYRKIDIEQIAYFSVLEKGVFLTTSDGHSYPVDISLDNLTTMVDPSQFFRINRRYLICLKSIVNMVSWSRSRIKLVLSPPSGDEMDTIVSIDRTADFKKWLNK